MMRVKFFIRRAAVALGLLFVCLVVPGRTGAGGDTIVLKNGRRIMALTAVVDGDKVRYETAAGELSLPRSIVDHIEKGGALQSAGPPAGASNLAIAPPSM